MIVKHSYRRFGGIVPSTFTVQKSNLLWTA